MNLPLHLIPGLTALALASALGFTQSPIATVPAATMAARHAGHGLRVDGAGLLGCGSDYLVRIDAKGAHFTPVLGHDVPAVAPLQLSLQSIHHGTTALPCDLQVAPAMAGSVAVYERSPVLRERYELRDSGMEQSFVFDTLPGRGDLVVRCRLGGLGELAVPAADGGLDCVRFGQRLVHMGTVTGIDGNGARVRGTIRRVGDCVELSLPAAFVDRAALPLVLDPFVGSVQPISVATSHDSNPHAVWHAQQQQWWCVFERAVSSTQTDVMIRALSPNGVLGTLLPVASVASTFHRAPRIAYHTGSHRCLVVFQVGTSEFAPHGIQGAVIDGNLATLTYFQVDADANSSFTAPDLSGDPTGAGQGVIAYVQQGSLGGIRLRPYTLGAAGVPTIGAQVTVSSDLTAARPRVSKSAATRLAIAFEAKPTAYYSAFLRAVSRTGTLQGGAVSVGNPSGPDRRRPDIDGDGDAFLMTMEHMRGVGDRDVDLAQWTWNGSGFGVPTATANVAGTNGVDEGRPTVALLGSKYAVAWQQATGFLGSVVKVRNYARSGCLTCGLPATVSYAGLQQQPSLASRLASGASDNQALLVFTQALSPFPPQGDILASQWDAHDPVTPTVLSPGCGYGTTLTLLGPPGIGNTAFGFRVTTNDPQAGLGAFLLGLGMTTPRLPCGVCMIVDSMTSSLAVLSGGTASYALPLPCNQALIGLSIQAQAATIGSVQNVCPALNTLSVSPAIAFSIAE